jgi:toxin ParE1/3/4
MNILQMTCVLKAAAGQAGRIMERIRSLSEMPMRYQLYGDEPWNSRELRFFSVDNYLVFYLPKENR